MRGAAVLVVQDTTEINFAGREKKRRGFGPGGNGETPGFFIHPVIAVDVETEAVVGLVDAAIWTRRQAATPARRSRRFEEKEWARWLLGCRAAAKTLCAARSLTMVADRESDIYPLFARKPEGLDLIVRAAQDRTLAEGRRLFDALSEAELLGVAAVRVAPRGPGDEGRIATVELRAQRVRLVRPNNGLVEDLPKTIELSLVERARSELRRARARSYGVCSPRIPSPTPRKPTKSCNSIACAGGSSRRFAPSRATAWRSKTAK